jgi:hypothetical protein
LWGGVPEGPCEGERESGLGDCGVLAGQQVGPWHRWQVELSWAWRESGSGHCVTVRPRVFSVNATRKAHRGAKSFLTWSCHI